MYRLNGTQINKIILQSLHYQLRMKQQSSWINKLIPTSLKRKPDFIIIGAQKGGTSSLFYYLSQHSQLSLPHIKEIHFFDNNYNKGIDWYKNQFPSQFIGRRKTGEASPYYLFHPHVPGRIIKCCPKIKFIVMLRNPVDRAYSHFMMQKKRKIELLSFEDAIKVESARLSEEENKLLSNPGYNSITHQQRSYIARGNYYPQLIRWFELFPFEQFLFINSEIFFDNPLTQLSKVYSFLNIKHETPYNLNPQNINEYELMKPNTRVYLNEYFASYNKKLAHLLGNEFTWSS